MVQNCPRPRASNELMRLPSSDQSHASGGASAPGCPGLPQKYLADQLRRHPAASASGRSRPKGGVHVVGRQTLYWQLLASGAGTVEACRQVGIGRKAGYRWPAEQGGIRPWVRPDGRMGQRMAAGRRTGRRQEKLSSERAGTRLCHSVESFGVMRSCEHGVGRGAHS
jgi:hypothetical protein